MEDNKSSVVLTLICLYYFTELRFPIWRPRVLLNLYLQSLQATSLSFH